MLSHLGRNFYIIKNSLGPLHHIASMLNQFSWVPWKKELPIGCGVASPILEKKCFLWHWIISPRILRCSAPTLCLTHGCKTLLHVLILTLCTITPKTWLQTGSILACFGLIQWWNITGSLSTSHVLNLCSMAVGSRSDACLVNLDDGNVRHPSWGTLFTKL